MKISLNIPWNRYGLIAELAYRRKNQYPQFGKTILQKMVYLLQEVYGIKCGYQFDLYTYGPFTSQLLQDLDLVETLGGIRVYPVTGGYHIAPGDQNDSLRETAKDFLCLPDVSRAIDNLVQDFGSLNAKELELLSTIVYVDRDMKSAVPPLTYEKMAQMVNDLKPKFSSVEIHDKISNLESKGVVSFS